MGNNHFRDQAAVKIIEKGEKRGAKEQWHIAPCEQVLLGLSAVQSIGEEKEKS